MKILILQSARVVFLMDKVVTVHIPTEVDVSPGNTGIWEVWEEFCSSFQLQSCDV